MTITIAYLYYNLLNLYGENGNIKMIKKILEKQGINVMVKFLDVTDELEFNKYDLVYMGSGNYENQELIIKHLSKYKKDIKKCLDNKKFFIITGNTLDIFGSHIIFPNKKIKALNIFDYYVKFEDINFADRALFKCKLIDEEIIGYQKQNSLMFNNNYSLFDVIEGIGENKNREGLIETPERIARMYEEIFAGMDMDCEEILSKTFTVDNDEMVIVKDITFYSTCEHHFMPFYGKAHVAYIPNGKVVGLSKLARAVEVYAKRPQIQEQLTGQVADALMEHLNPKGVIIMMEAEHMCMTMRGVKKPGSKTVTFAMRGAFEEDENLVNRFLMICK